MKKSILIGLFFVIPLLLYATGTQEEQQTTRAAEKTLMRWVTLFNPPEVEMVKEAINEKMEKDGLNLEFQIIDIPWEAWEQKTNIMLSTGEEFELMLVMDDVIPIPSYVGRGATTPLDEYFQYGPTLKKVIPEFKWKGVTFNGKIHSIPCYFNNVSSPVERITIRKDLFEKHGVEIPKTPEELINAVETINKKEPELQPLAWTKIVADTSEFLHRAYPAWPFTVIDELFYVDNKGNVKSWIETQEFKDDCTFWRTLYTKNLVNPDILSLPGNVRGDSMNQGKFVFDHSDALGIWPTLQKNVPEAEIELIVLNPDMPRFNNIGTRHSNFVPSTTSHPEAAIQFMNWLYSSQENHDLLMYGIEGRHWRKLPGEKLQWKGLEADVIEIINDPSTNKPRYNGPAWAMQLSPMVSFFKGQHPEFLPKFLPFFDTIDSIAVGFRFDSEPVSTEYANLRATTKEVIWPIKFGVLDYKDAYSSALAKMKSAGLDKVVNEFKRQFANYLEE